ncbi:MAG: rhomboid family intramembrane serine protease [Phenylobacterium sp.]
MGAMTAAWFEETPAGPPRETPPAPQPDFRPAREPIFNNAPWPVLVLVGLIALGYAVQSRLPQDWVGRWVFAPADLAAGHYETLISAIFLHANWSHALMNAAFVFAFGTPVVRFLGPGARGAAAFFGFYLLCGALANLGYALAHLGSPAAVVGASGAASGLMGAAARLIAGRGLLGRILSPTVLGMGAAWVIVNILVGVLFTGLTPGAGGLGIAWEAHLAGFAAGVLLIAPFAWLARRGS